MRIAIDVSQMIYDFGVSVYTENLVKNLLKIDNKDEFILYGGSLRGRNVLEFKLNELKKVGQFNNVKYKIFPISPFFADILWNRLHVLNIERLIGKVDVLHSSDWVQPPSLAFKVSTIHDLIPLKFPMYSDPKIISVHKARLRWVVKEVDRIIVPSKTTYEDCLDFGFRPERISIIPEAPDPIFKPAKKYEVEKVKRKYLISGNFILAIGTSPRKNVKRVIEAFERIKPITGLKLVVIGSEVKGISPIRGVKFLGFVPKLDLPKLFTAAEALVYPSLYEGFGLPILESFACKTPVVTSNLGSMREIGKDAAFLVDPQDPVSISEGILNVLKKKDFWVKKGLSVLKRYDWIKTAKATLEVYKKLAL